MSSEKSLVLWIGALAVIVVYFLNRSSSTAPPTSDGGAPNSPSAAVGANPLGAASGTLDDNGNPIGGLGSS